MGERRTPFEFDPDAFLVSRKANYSIYDARISMMNLRGIRAKMTGDAAALRMRVEEGLVQ